MSRKNWREYWYRKWIWRAEGDGVRRGVGCRARRGVPGGRPRRHLLQGLHGEVDAAAGGGQWQVLLGHGLHLLHDDVRLLHLPRHLGSLSLEVLQRRDDGVVVQDAPLHLVQSLQQRLLQLAQTQLELPCNDRTPRVRQNLRSSRGNALPSVRINRRVPVPPQFTPNLLRTPEATDPQTHLEV